MSSISEEDDEEEISLPPSEDVEEIIFDCLPDSLQAALTRCKYLLRLNFTFDC
jgi:hypothetical protein